MLDQVTGRRCVTSDLRQLHRDDVVSAQHYQLIAGASIRTLPPSYGGNQHPWWRLELSCSHLLQVASNPQEKPLSQLRKESRSAARHGIRDLHNFLIPLNPVCSTLDKDMAVLYFAKRQRDRLG